MTTQWFVKPMDDHTNGVVSEMLHVSESGAAQLQMRDNKGKVHNVWQCEYADIDQLNRSKRRNAPLAYRVFKRDGSFGAMCSAPKFAQPRRQKKHRLSIPMVTKHLDNAAR